MKKTGTSKNSSKSSSNSSSSSSSPVNTLRANASMYSFAEILAESQLDKLSAVELLLQDTHYLDLLCERASEYAEFPALLFRFFHVHDKTHYLLQWALEKDINTLSPNELFRGETMATRLFYYQFFGDLGKRFLTSVLSKLIEEFAVLDHSVEVEPGRLTAIPATEEVNPAENLKWILRKLKIFIKMLQEAADLCPLGLRESFLFLKDVVGSKVENSNVFVASVLFLRLICPCLIAPEEYEIMHNLSVKKVSEHGKRGLVIASKILQSAANNYKWEDRPGSKKVNKFIAKANPIIVKFASELIDQETIVLGRKVMRASMIPISRAEIDLCHEALKLFVMHNILQKRLQSEVDYEEKYQLAMKMYNSKDWKVTHEAKKEGCEYSVSQQKQDGSSLVAFRYSGRYQAKFELVRDYLRNNNPEMTMDERVLSNQVIERHSKDQFDTYWVLRPQFPVAGRDFVYTSKQTDESQDRWIQVTYSIEKDDKPSPRGFVRGNINVMFSVVERDPSDPEYTLYTYIFHVDLKGWIPSMVINNNAKMSFNSLAKNAKRIMALGKPEQVVIEKKSKRKKDKKIMATQSAN